MKKILVTGATGFIGRHVLEYLLKGKYPENYLILASSSNEQKARETPWFDKVKYFPFDFKNIQSQKNYYSFFSEPDIMIHLAWEGLPNYKSSFHLDENLPRHYAFLKNMIKNGLADLTVTGTCLEYGTQEGMLKEDLLSFPSNPYAKAKNELRKLLESLEQSHSFSFKWIRLFYMYGEGQSPNSLLSQLEKAIETNKTVFNMSGGEQIRDYLKVEKVAEYIVKIALQKKVEGIVNCCSGIPITVKEFVENYLRQKNKRIKLNLGFYPYPDYEPMKFWGNNSKLKTILENE